MSVSTADIHQNHALTSCTAIAGTSDGPSSLLSSKGDGNKDNGVVEVDNDNSNEDNDNKDELSPYDNEQYRIWKKNCPYLYDVIISHELEWPSLTVQWMESYVPGAVSTTTASSTTSTTVASSSVSQQYDEHELLLGTQAGEESDDNYLIYGIVKIPKSTISIDTRKYDEEKDEIGGYGSGPSAKFDFNLKIKHKGDINRARMKPDNKFITATRSSNGNVYIFDKTKHSSIQSSNDDKSSLFNPQLICSGLIGEGFSLDWNNSLSSSASTKGLVMSSDINGDIAIWNIDGHPLLSKSANTITPLHKIDKAHDGGVGDTQWSYHHPSLFASCGNDSSIKIWDIRTLQGDGSSNSNNQTSPSPTITIENAHSSDVNCLAYSPHSEFLFASGGGDNLIKLWDHRNTSRPIYTLNSNECEDETGGEVYQISWCPFNESFISSCGSNKGAIIWDISKMGDEKPLRDEYSPELFFKHAGHTSIITDISWNIHQQFMLATVSDDNILQIWQISDNIINKSYGNESTSINNKVPDIDIENEPKKKKQMILKSSN